MLFHYPFHSIHPSGGKSISDAADSAGFGALTGGDTLGSPTCRTPGRGPLTTTLGLLLLLLPMLLPMLFPLLEKLKLLGVLLLTAGAAVVAAVDTVGVAGVAAEESGVLACALLTPAYRAGSGIWKPLPGFAAAYAAAYAGSWLKLQRSPFRHVPFSKKKRHGLVR